MEQTAGRIANRGEIGIALWGGVPIILTLVLLCTGGCAALTQPIGCYV